MSTQLPAPRFDAENLSSRSAASSDHARRVTRLTGACANILQLASQVREVPTIKTRRLRGPEIVIVDFALKSLQETLDTNLEISSPRDTRLLINACRRIADWAGYCRVPGTALGYVSAAMALQAPEFEIALQEAQKGKLSRALEIFKLAAHYGEAANEGAQAASAWTKIGRIQLILKKYKLAQEAHANALRIARAYRLEFKEAQALHNLAVVSFAQKNGTVGYAYARLAMQAYGRDYDALRILANDVAWYWMTSEGEYSKALGIFEAILPHAQQNLDRLDFLANIARAAAGSGNQEKFQDAWVKVHELGKIIPHEERLAGALLDLGEGACLLGRLSQAREVALRARAIAEKRGEIKYVTEADDLLERLQRPVAKKADDALPSPISAFRNHELATRFVLLLNAASAVVDSTHS